MAPKSGRAKPLTIEEIAETALAIVDREGLDGLSMRALGRALHCDPMAVYRHVKDREELLALVASLVIAEIESPPIGDDPAAELLALAENARAVFHRHPHAMILIGHSQLSGSTGLGVLERLADALGGQHAGAPAAAGTLADRINAYVGALIGYVTLELSPPATRPRPAYVHAEVYPVLDRHSVELRGATFGLRSEAAEIVPLPGGFTLLMRTVIAGLLPS